MKRATILSVLFLSSGCANVSAPPTVAEEIDRSIANATPPPSQPVSVKPTVPTKANVILARTAAKQILKDPNSSQFSQEIQYPEAICGFVNSKNSYGGYVGNSPYIYVNGTREVFLLQHSGTDRERINNLKAMRRYCPD